VIHRINYSSICLLRGQEYEMKCLQAKFALLRDNKRQLIARTLLLNGFTNWFSYTGSIGTVFLLQLLLGCSLYTTTV
jgi:ABC-type uncharacterized transport system fused permease/ATPase subunit